MGDRPYLTSNRNGNGARTLNGGGAAANGGSGGPPAFPAAKAAQQYSATRPLYRPLPPQPPRRRRRRRGCCCTCCLWLTLLLIALIFLVAIATGVFYVLYHPQRPNFSIESVRLAAFNITSSNLLTSRLDLVVSARNPNRKVVFLYDDVAISAYSDGVDIGQGLYPAFVHGTENTTALKGNLNRSLSSLDSKIVVLHGRRRGRQFGREEPIVSIDAFIRSLDAHPGDPAFLRPALKVLGEAAVLHRHLAPSVIAAVRPFWTAARASPRTPSLFLRP